MAWFQSPGDSGASKSICARSATCASVLVRANRREWLPVARDHSRHVSVQHSVLLVECDAENCGGRVFANSGKRQDFFARAREFAAVPGDDLLRGVLQIARAAVIAQSGPQAQDFFLRSFGQRFDVREIAPEISRNRESPRRRGFAAA